MEGITWDWVQEPSAKTQMTNYLRATFGHITKRFDEMNEKSEQGSQIIVEFQKMSELFRARKMPAPLLKAAGEHPHSGSARHAPLGPPVTSDSCTFSARASITGIWSTVDASSLWNRRSGSECVRSARVCMCLLWSGSS